MSSPDLHAWIIQQVDHVEQLVSENEWPPSQAEGVRLRCESDRRILDRHRSVNNGYSVECEGCGTTGICDDPVARNVNECPELLDLAHAHGLTPEIFAGLDTPQPPKREPSEPSPPGQAMTQVWGDQILASLHTTCIVPAALRGSMGKAME